MKWAAALFAILIPTPVEAEVPDYLAYQDKLDRFVMAASSVPVCMNFGYPDTVAAMGRKGQSIVDDAVLGGIPEGSAALMFSSTLEAETQRQIARLKDPENRDDTIAYWHRRCATMALDPEYGSYFRK